MARLNEPSQPSVESIDALKRRFVRQNREIARANSTQSLRIRNLEGEVSRLLSENVSLREQIIKSQYEAEKSTNTFILESVDGVKGKLEAKLAEFGKLIEELGEVKRNTEAQQPRKRQSISHDLLRRSPDQKIWKNTLTLSEVTGAADGRLPPIVEDKYYPRRTMDAEELLGIFANPDNINDSPELGPPPIAHFEEGDPIKFDRNQEKLTANVVPDDIGEQPKLSANLETRKKRRESSHHKDGAQRKGKGETVLSGSSNDAAAAIDQPLKSGAKRKLNVREDEERAVRMGDTKKGSFPFNPRNGGSNVSETSGIKPSISRTGRHAGEKRDMTIPSTKQGVKGKEAQTTITATTNSRKALNPKSVNTDPVNSPIKSAKPNQTDQIIQAKDDLAKIVREHHRAKEKSLPGKRPETAKDQVTSISSSTAVKSVEPPPETPAPTTDDVFSPVSSEPSAAHPESRDTPPPPELGPDTGTGSFGRASRRQKGSVSYVQPNLRDKMRRPTKDLVDAVGAEERARQANLAKAEWDASHPVTIKQEEEADGLPVWKTNCPKESHRNRAEAESPLGNKSLAPAIELPASVITDRRRRATASFSQVDERSTSKQSSGAGSVIAALAAGSQRPKRNEEDRLVKETEEGGKSHKVMEKGSIYDFTGSSPLDPEGTITETEERVKPPSRVSRRHSSVPATSEIGKDTITISRRGGDRKPENIPGRSGDERTGKEQSRLELKRVKSVIDVAPGAAEDVVLGRGERAASRRRSMML